MLCSFATAAICLLLTGTSFAQTVAAPPASDGSATGESPAVAGQKIYIDPATGQMTSPPESEPGPQPKAKGSASNAPTLVEEPLPSGGFKLNTQGQFQVPLKATRNAEGEIVIEHGDGSGAEP